MSKSLPIKRQIGSASVTSSLVRPLADQLHSHIKDYDVCLIVSKMYIQMRTVDATEECREFYMSRIWEEKPGLTAVRNVGSLGALAKQTYLWNPDYIEQREEMFESRGWSLQPRKGYIPTHLGWRDPPPILKSIIPTSHLSYLTSNRGIRSAPTWQEAASRWSIKDFDKENCSLKDKLDDLKLIPNNHPNVMRRLVSLIARNEQ